MGRPMNLILKVFHKANFLPNSIVTRSWHYGNASGNTVPEKDFKKLNALCIKKKAVNAKVRFGNTIGSWKSEEGNGHKDECA